MKKTISMILCILLIASLTVPAFAYNPSGNGEVRYTITGQDVFLRNGPNPTATPLGQFDKNDYFWVNDTSNSSWYGGYPDTATNIYQHYDYAVYGYVSTIYL